MRTVFNKTSSAVALVAAAAVPAVASAQTAPAAGGGADYSTLTAAVDWSSAITALMAVAAVVAGVLVVRKGIRFVLGAIK